MVQWCHIVQRALHQPCCFSMPACSGSRSRKKPAGHPRRANEGGIHRQNLVDGNLIEGPVVGALCVCVGAQRLR